MSTMASLNDLVNALHDMSTTSLLLASKLSSTTPSRQTYFEALAEFNRHADMAQAMFGIARKSAPNGVKVKEDEDKENRDYMDKDEEEESKGEGEHKAGPRRWSERVASEVEVRLKTQVVPSIQLGFRAYLEKDVIPGLEDRVLARLEQRVRDKDRPLDPPPYDSHSPGCKRSTESAPTQPEDRPGKRERLS